MWKELSAIADVFTVLGVGGIVSWSVFRKNRTGFERAVISFLVTAIKVALLLLLALPFFMLFDFLNSILLIFLRDLAGLSVDLHAHRWVDTENPLPGVIAIVVAAIAVLPVYLLVGLMILRRKWAWLFRLLGVQVTGDGEAHRG